MEGLTGKRNGEFCADRYHAGRWRRNSQRERERERDLQSCRLVKIIKDFTGRERGDDGGTRNSVKKEGKEMVFLTG